jgi:hypothetical protein
MAELFNKYLKIIIRKRYKFLVLLMTIIYIKGIDLVNQFKKSCKTYKPIYKN